VSDLFSQYAICKRCGHEPSGHTTTLCSHGHSANIMAFPPCDCKGWERDEGWPKVVNVTAPERPRK
jgi:hypothetical protein